MNGRTNHIQTNEFQSPCSSSDEEVSDCFLDEVSLLEFLEGSEMAQRELVISTTSAEETSTQTGTTCNGPPDISNYTKMLATSRRTAPQTKPWYKRRNEEVLYLREKVKQLSAWLDHLKLEATLRSELDKEQITMTSTPELELWKSLAARQEKEREESEVENEKLRKILQHRVAQAKALQRAFKRRLREDSVRDAMNFSKRCRVDVQVWLPPTNSAVVFKDLSTGIDEEFANLDILFDSIKMNELPCPGRRNNTVNSRAKGKHVEFLDCYAFPFDFKQVDRTMWSLGSDGIEDVSATFVEKFPAGSYTKCKSVGFAFRSKSLDVRVVMRKVGRRYALDDRTVFIWRTLIEPKHDSLTTMAFRETTCLVLRPGQDTHTGPTTIMQSHRQVAAGDGGRISSHTYKSFRGTDISTAVWNDSITKFNHYVEDTLLQQQKLK
ncbi:hypothetical protein AM587_10007991 [Phytophthora nicotianae]|uniref:M96 mating-specific protein family n=1 Tax=Phytophthora nicotianae TaxID=4792 RepID=A0A0W8C505_PHYNI|nr:hypothetical protein AM587_10007991 [Phytophthora nicotianae]